MAKTDFIITPKEIPKQATWDDLADFLPGKYNVILSADVQWDDPAGAAKSNPIGLAIDLDACDEFGRIRSWDNDAYLRLDEMKLTEDAKNNTRTLSKTVVVNLDKKSLLKLMILDQSFSRLAVNYHVTACNISLEDVA